MEEFAELLGVPEIFRPYLRLAGTGEERRLVETVGRQRLREEEIASRMGMEASEAHDLVWGAYSRALLDIVEEGDTARFSVSDFYSRLDNLCLFEPEVYDSLPRDVRDGLAQWSLSVFTGRMERHLQEPQAKPPAAFFHSVMLLDQVEDVIDQATDIILVDCDCRRLSQRCDKPVTTCLHMSTVPNSLAHRGLGTRIDKERAKELVRWADDQGLVHCANSNYKTEGPIFICNCDTCCCFPFNTALRLNSRGTYPATFHVAFHDPEACNRCGRCARRCPFGAFTRTGTGSEKGVVFNAEMCWGCGLCARTCPRGAIAMVPLPEAKAV
ncbi:MAG: 4Fe-4S binding protein [Bacillota bacterium]|jgi:NAD-dependent dihydropyrimidine dehydrogenase PreA subunit